MVLNYEYAKKHWVSQELYGYPIPSEIRHQWRLKLIDWESKMEKFWNWGWIVAMLGVGILLYLTGCSTLDNYTPEERRASWYKACVETSNLPDSSKEICRWRADRIIIGD